MNGKCVLLLLWFASNIFLVKNDTPVGLAYTSPNGTRTLKIFLEYQGSGKIVDAIRGCNSRGMNLGGIESLTEWEYLVNMMIDAGYNGSQLNNGSLFWTSGNKWSDPKSAKYSWLFSGNPLETILFAEGQPNGYDCVMIVNWDRPDHLGYQGFALNDADCTNNAPGYLCESRDT